MYRLHLSIRPMVTLLILALIWGANLAIIKIGAQDLPSLFMAGFRSLVAAICLYIWMKIKGINPFPSRKILVHGIVIGVLFGSEFGFIYTALEFTTASRSYVLVYTAPFFVALGAHFFLRDDRLNPWKIAGLVMAFAGIFILFIRKLGTFSLVALPGDMMAIVAGALWGATTVYLKKYLSRVTVPLQTLFYQVCFSAPLLLFMSFVLEDPFASRISWSAGFSVFYQCIIVAFLSYLVWFELIHRYPVSLLHAFTFFTPVFGVFLGGLLILGEEIGLNLIVALTLVSVGTVFVNKRPSS
ncbi:MAG: DMT family transporter [Deltaproteobacteria bacterium]|nr:DMT family transporter [Deltaproteobacteria bacterium]MBW2063819.1 DMT family transporter [Deltaproteobacteria bacterium]